MISQGGSDSEYEYESDEDGIPGPEVAPEAEKEARCLRPQIVSYRVPRSTLGTERGLYSVAWTQPAVPFLRIG